MNKAAEALGEDCPEWCGHGGPCAGIRAAIHKAEEQAESAWLREAEAGYPGYDYDPNDPMAMDR